MAYHTHRAQSYGIRIHISFNISIKSAYTAQQTAEFSHYELWSNYIGRAGSVFKKRPKLQPWYFVPWPIFGCNSLIWADIAILTKTHVQYKEPSSTGSHGPDDLDLQNAHMHYFGLQFLFEAILRNLWLKIGHTTFPKVIRRLTTVNLC